MALHKLLRDAAEKVGIKKVGERTSLLWHLSEKKGDSKTYYDEDLGDRVKHRVQERKDWWEVWAAPLADALKICREKTRGEEGIWTCCSLEDQEFDPLYKREKALVC